jgi:hypothetical protein
MKTDRVICRLTGRCNRRALEKNVNRPAACGGEGGFLNGDGREGSFADMFGGNPTLRDKVGGAGFGGGRSRVVGLEPGLGDPMEKMGLDFRGGKVPADSDAPQKSGPDPRCGGRAKQSDGNQSLRRLHRSRLHAEPGATQPASRLNRRPLGNPALYR